MATVTYIAPAGAAEIMLALPEPVEHGPILPFPLTELKHARMVTAIGLPPGVPRRVSRWHALWLGAVRKKAGPWFQVRLNKGDWEKCVIQAGGMLWTLRWLRAPWLTDYEVHMKPWARARPATRAKCRAERAAAQGWLRTIADATRFADPELVKLVQNSIAAPRMVSNAAGNTTVWDIAGGSGRRVELYGVEVYRPN